MKLETNGDYNRIQINFSQDKTADGKVIKQSIMLNIREESVQKAYTLYQELMRRIEGGKETVEKPKKKSKKEEEVKKEPEGIETPTCECGNPMVLKSGKWGSFWSCSTYPLCRLTKPFLTAKEKKQLEDIPCDQDIMVPTETPF